MADQRQPFRFRLPWMPPTQTTTTPAPTPAPAPAPAPRIPSAAPPRPPFRPGGVAPTQPSPRANLPPTTTTTRASEEAPPPKATSPPKTAPLSKPIASTSSPPKTAPPSKPIASTSSPPKTAPPSKPIASTSSPPKTAPPSKPIASTSSPPKTAPPSKPIASTSSPPKTVPPSKPVASTSSPPKTAPPSKPVPSTPLPPRTEPPSKPIASTPPSPRTEPPSKPVALLPSTSSPPKTRSPSSPVSPLKEDKTAISRPISPSKPPTAKSPSGPLARPSSPSLSSSPSPRDKGLKKPHDSPKRQPSPMKYQTPPTMVDQGSSSKKEPQQLQAQQQQQQATIVSESAPGNGKLPHSSPEPIQKPVMNIPDSKEQKDVKRVVIDESIINQSGEPRKKEVVTEVPESETVLQPVSMSRVGQRPAERSSHPKVSKPHNHSHKPAWEKAPLQKEIKEDISKFVHKLGVGQGKQTLDGEKKLTVITLAGENRGASMTLSNETRRKESSIHIHRGYKANPDERIENSTDGDESSMADEETTTKAYINSNVQGINNSLLFNGSVSTRSPGVRYVRCSSLKEGAKGRRHDQDGSFETNKAEFSGTQSEMLTYAPNVRRRCLRSLLMESGDSDPEKPCPYGCEYECKYKKKDENINVV